MGERVHGWMVSDECRVKRFESPRERVCHDAKCKKQENVKLLKLKLQMTCSSGFYKYPINYHEIALSEIYAKFLTTIGFVFENLGKIVAIGLSHISELASNRISLPDCAADNFNIF